MDLSVIIPAYREAEALDLLLPDLKRSLAEITPSAEILVVDTAEPLDQTQQVCEQHDAKHVRRMGGNDYVCAIRTGIERARGEFILMMDADGSHDTKEIQRLWNEREKRQIVIGSRYVEGGETENPAVLIFMSYVVNVIFRVAFGLSCRDVSNSFRLYRAATLKATPIESVNFDLIPELLIRITKEFGPQSVCEVPIHFRQRVRGESKRNLVTFALGYVYTIWRLKRMTAGKPAEPCPVPRPRMIPE